MFFISTLLSFLQKAPYFFVSTRIKIGSCEDTTGAESKEGLWGSGFVRCVTKASTPVLTQVLEYFGIEGLTV